MSRFNKWFCVAAVWPVLAGAQTQADLARILERLDRLEQENHSLGQQVQELRAQLAAGRGAAPVEDASKATVEERLEIQEHRVEEQAQTKVEASQKFPIQLTGMALFNTFLDSKQSGASDYPTIAFPTGAARAGATLRQTIVGLRFHGPRTFLGGEVQGSIFMDFFPGGAQTMRLRTASIEIDWAHRNIMVGLDKPIFNPREPTSLAQVGISPLTSAGNLWLWLPQVRVQQDILFGAGTGLRARMGVVQTREAPAYDGTGGTAALAPSRPGLEGRFEFFHNLDSDRRLEIAPGFHTSTTHDGGFSIPSNLFSLDWFFNPWRKVEFSGAFYTGKNVANLGTGAINQGFALYRKSADAINGRGGWGQLTVHALRRVDLHLFTGQQDDENAQLGFGDIGKNIMLGANLFYRMAPNVIFGPEISQVRTNYIGQGTRLNNHYDLALGYLF